MSIPKSSKERGFTIMEMLIVVLIITVISTMVMISVQNAREKGRDGARKSQSNEVLKALELYYTDNAGYPLAGGAVDTGVSLDQIDSSYYGPNSYLNRLPDNASTEYYYCVSADRKTSALSIDIERGGGSDWCHIVRGQGNTGCDAWIAANAADSCAIRF